MRSSEVRQAVGQRLREERAAAGLTQAQLAAAMSELAGATMDPSALARIERGERGIQLDEAVLLAQILGIRLDDLVSSSLTVEAKLRRLHLELERRSNRVAMAEHELHQAQQAEIDIRAQIDAVMREDEND